MGDRARRLQRHGRRLELFHPRPGPVPRLPLGRGRDWPASPTTSRHLCFALALWNGVDPIIKERLFGLTNSEGNHGEDVKEYYYYLDSTPTHSYMKYLYKYPQSAFPYDDLVQTNASRGRHELEYELIDTGVFDEDRYFDVFVEYAKASPEDLLVRVTAWNRGPEPATLHLLPTLWFRNTWWHRPEDEPRPRIDAACSVGQIAGSRRRIGRGILPDSARPSTPSWAPTASSARATPGSSW